MLNFSRAVFKRTVKYVFRKLGYEISGLSETRVSGLPYRTVRSHATYSPWITDQDFQEAYQKIRDFTLVDEYRCYELWTLVEQTEKLSGGIIEVGVWRGGTGALIAEKARLCGIKYPVYLADTFTGVVKASAQDSRYRGGEHADTSRSIVESLVYELFKLENVRILSGVFPDGTSRFVESEQFRFCHIDVDVYQSAKDVLEWIWDKMVIGGVIVYDDYGFFGCDGITKLVNEQRYLKDRLVIHNLNGHALTIKIK